MTTYLTLTSNIFRFIVIETKCDVLEMLLFAYNSFCVSDDKNIRKYTESKVSITHANFLNYTHESITCGNQYKCLTNRFSTQPKVLRSFSQIL